METCTDAEHAARSRDLTLNDAKLSMKLLLPGRPPTFVAAGDGLYLRNSFLFTDLPQRVDANKLWQYAEKAASMSVDKIIFSYTNPSSALVRYTADPGIENVFLFLLNYMCLSAWISQPILLLVVRSFLHDITNSQNIDVTDTSEF